MAVTVQRYRQSCKKVKQQIAGWFCETTLQDLIDKNVHVPTFLVFFIIPVCEESRHARQGSLACPSHQRRALIIIAVLITSRLVHSRQLRGGSEFPEIIDFMPGECVCQLWKQQPDNQVEEFVYQREKHIEPLRLKVREEYVKQHSDDLLELFDNA